MWGKGLKGCAKCATIPDLLPQIDVDVFGLRKEAQGLKSPLTAYSGGLHAAKGRPQVAHEPIVDPNNAAVNVCGYAVRALEIFGPNSGRQAVLGGIS